MISYKPLFHTLIEKDLTRADLKECSGLGANTISKLYNGRPVSLDVLERLCLALNVPLSSVVEVLPEDGAPAKDSEAV